MAALDEQQRKFVLAFINGGRQWRGEGGSQGLPGFRPNAKEAAKAAGYGTPDSSDEYLRVQGHRVLHSQKVQDAILEFSRKDVMVAAAVIATPVVISIALDEEAPKKERLRACEMLFNRGGMPAMTEHKVTVEHVDDSRLLEFVDKLAGELGVDRSRLIGRDMVPASSMRPARQIEGKVVARETNGTEPDADG
jgi:phage terminase small subunit